MFYIYCTRCIIITISKDTCDSGGKGGGGGGGMKNDPYTDILSLHL